MVATVVADKIADLAYNLAAIRDLLADHEDGSSMVRQVRGRLQDAVMTCNTAAFEISQEIVA
jgi:hypothetical protein